MHLTHGDYDDDDDGVWNIFSFSLRLMRAEESITKRKQAFLGFHSTPRLLSFFPQLINEREVLLNAFRFLYSAPRVPYFVNAFPTSKAR